MRRTTKYRYNKSLGSSYVGERLVRSSWEGIFVCAAPCARASKGRRVPEVAKDARRQRAGRVPEREDLRENVVGHDTLTEANNYAATLKDLRRFEEAKALLRRTIPVARRVLGESNETTLRMRWNYARALYKDDDATLYDLCEADGTLEEIERIARRVLGGAHPLTAGIGRELPKARAALQARAPSVPSNYES